MKIKKVVMSILTLIGMTIILGGCGMNTQKETLTKEQQENIVKRIVKSYTIQSIEFLDFYQDQKTGTYLINIKINEDSNLVTTIAIRNLERLNNSEDPIGLNPIDNFEELETKEAVENLEISGIKIIYLEGEE